MIFLASYIASALLAAASDLSWLSGTPICDCPKPDDSSPVYYRIDSFDRCLTAAYGAPSRCPDDVDAVAKYSDTSSRPLDDISSLVIPRPVTDRAVLTTIKLKDKNVPPNCLIIRMDSASRTAVAVDDDLLYDEADKSLTITVSPEVYDILPTYPITLRCVPGYGFIFKTADGLTEATYTYQRQAPASNTTPAPQSSAPDGTTFHQGIIISLLGASAIYWAV